MFQVKLTRKIISSMFFIVLTDVLQVHNLGHCLNHKRGHYSFANMVIALFANMAIALFANMTIALFAIMAIA